MSRAASSALRTALVALCVATVGTAAFGSDGRPSIGATTLLLWPAGAPEFGDLPGGGPGTTVVVADLSTGRHRVARITQIAPGDFPVPLASVGRWLVYNGTYGVSAIHANLTDHPRVLGLATYFVPAATPDRVWLVRQDPSRGTPVAIRQVLVASGRTGPAMALPSGTAGVVRGTKAGLLLVSKSGALESWHPRRSPVVLGSLGPLLAGAGFAADSHLAAYGSDCRPREATSGFVHTPVGYETCTALNVLDVITRQRLVFPAPPGTLGWAPGGFGLENVIAPGDELLVARAVTRPARRGQARFYVLRLARGAVPTPLGSSPVPIYSRAAWTADGSWVLYEDPDSHLAARQIATGRIRTFPIKCCRYTAMLAIRTPAG